MEDGLAYVWPDGATGWTEILWSDWVAFVEHKADRLPGVVGNTYIILCYAEDGVVVNIFCHHELFDADGRSIKKLTVLSDEEVARKEALMWKSLKEGDLYGEENRIYGELCRRDWEGSLPAPDKLRAFVGVLRLPVSPEHGAQHLLRKAGLDRLNWTAEASC